MERKFPPITDSPLVIDEHLFCLNCGVLINKETPRYALFTCDKCDATIAVADFIGTIKRHPHSSENVLPDTPADQALRERINHCLDALIQEDVDDVVTAFCSTYSLLAKNKYSTDAHYTNILNRFVHQMMLTLDSKKYARRTVVYPRGGIFLFSRPTTNKIVNSIHQGFLETLSQDDALTFLAELISAYALSVPEPLFRAAERFKGSHKTYETPAIDDNLPMTDEMIIFAWKYFWFYTWLGY